MALGPYEFSAKFRVAEKKLGQNSTIQIDRQNFYMSREFAGGATLSPFVISRLTKRGDAHILPLVAVINKPSLISGTIATWDRYPNNSPAFCEMGGEGRMGRERIQLQLLLQLTGLALECMFYHN